MRYQIGRYTFATKEEYEAGKRDAKKIRALADSDGSDLERSKKVLTRVYEENITFETWLGKDFIRRLREHVKEEERKNSRWKRVWFYVRYPVLAIVAAILVSQFLQGPLDGIKSHSFFQQMRKEREASDGSRRYSVLAEHNSQKEKIEEASKKGEKTKEKAAASKDSARKTKEEMKEKKKEILPAYRTLWEKNHDLCGWLTIEGTGIDYPVMYKKKDSEYYLHHNFEKEKDTNGLLVLDRRCDLSKKGEQHIIYGHNMRSGVMFGELLNYKEESYYKKHPMLLLDSLFAEETYEIIAVYLSKVYYEDEDVFKFYDYTRFSSKKEFQTYYQNIKKQSLYEIDVKANYGDTLLTLVTCEYSQENGRLVVTARRAGH